METWNEILVKIIQEANRPLIRREIFDIINNQMGLRVFSNNLGVHLNNAKKKGIITHIKIPPSDAGYYCNPNWVGEDGKLKPEYSYDPFWSLKTNTNPEINESN